MHITRKLSGRMTCVGETIDSILQDHPQIEESIHGVELFLNLNCQERSLKDKKKKRFDWSIVPTWWPNLQYATMIHKVSEKLNVMFLLVASHDRQH